jgi:hypothetical protein
MQCGGGAKKNGIFVEGGFGKTIPTSKGYVKLR